MKGASTKARPSRSRICGGETQGWKVADAGALSQMDIPEHEAVIEIPAALLRYMTQHTR